MSDLDTNVDYYNGARVHASLDGDIPTEIGGKSTTRRAEAEYALARIRKLPWVDQDQVFLIGVSQGGRIVAPWEKSGFAARIGQGGARLRT